MRETNNAQARNALWRIAISPAIGMDIQEVALKILAANPSHEDSQIKTLAEHVHQAFMPEAAFAAYLLQAYGHLSEGHTKLQGLAEHAQDFFTNALDQTVRHYIAPRKYIHFARLQGYLHNLFALYETQDRAAYRRHHLQNLSAVNRKLRRMEHSSRQKFRGGVTIGTEIQGHSQLSLSLRHQYNEIVFVDRSPHDYARIQKLANFLPSNDQFYEYSLFPDYDPRTQLMTASALIKAGVIPAIPDYARGHSILSYNVTLGGIKSSYQHREAAAIQAVILGSHLGYAAVELAQSEDFKGWNVHYNKRAIRNRLEWRGITPDREIQITNDPRTSQHASELRLLVMDTPLHTARMLYEIKAMGNCALEYQKMIDEERYHHLPAHLWIAFIHHTTTLFQTYNLPGPTAVWTFQDLDALTKSLESGPHNSFSRQLRSEMTQLRIAYYSLPTKRSARANRYIADTPFQPYALPPHTKYTGQEIEEY